ncbi:MAG: leucine-rich repeat domain-containing protein [Butyrivibrio sp.]|nr:leucine-rich repeat domain-containing protein [Butyrivibrio sp.]
MRKIKYLFLMAILTIIMFIPIASSADSGTTSPWTVGMVLESTDGFGKYQITSTTSCTGKLGIQYHGTVTLIGPGSYQSTGMTVDENITLTDSDGYQYTYKVTEIAPNAFKNDKKLLSFTISSTSAVTVIPKGMCSGCSKMTVLKLYSNNIKKIQKKAFKGCKKLKSVYTGSRKKVKKYQKMVRKAGAKKAKASYGISL